MRAIILFILAGLAEIGGGYLIWMWLREGTSWIYGAIGAVILIAYGILPTLQTFPSFGRVYAAYGGVFIVLALLWGWAVDNHPPDKYDWLGAMVCLIGTSIILWGPRH